MSDKTKIEWSDATWNPVTGCSKVSEGCRNCYALTFAERFRGTPGHYFEHGFDVTLRPDKLDQPLRWRRPRRIFVNSMSDLFHQEVPQDFIDKVFAVMAAAEHHTFMILTKRPERMKDYIRGLEKRRVVLFPGHEKLNKPIGRKFPLPNVWLGVSVENQKAAAERIPLLLSTPATVRFLSCEPLLGPVDLKHIFGLYEPDDGVYALKVGSRWADSPDWVIVGGESGHKARPMHPDWARSLRDQCQAAGVPFFFKQWGEWLPFIDSGNGLCFAQNDLTDADWKRESQWLNESDGIGAIRVGKKAAWRMLDGRTWEEFPEVQP